jgi:hypothetical protein
MVVISSGPAAPGAIVCPGVSALHHEQSVRLSRVVAARLCRSGAVIVLITR